MTIPHPKRPVPPAGHAAPLASQGGAGTPGPFPSPVGSGPGPQDPGSSRVSARAAGPVPLPAGRGREEPCLAGMTLRSWIIVFPAGLDLLNANGRGHWRVRHRITAELRAVATWLARQQRIPRLERAYITAVYEPPDRRRRDAPNWYPSFKAAIDGLVDAGVLPDDSDRYVTALEMRCGEPCPRGRIVLHVTEVPAETPQGAA